jgi:hypothetical protein
MRQRVRNPETGKLIDVRSVVNKLGQMGIIAHELEQESNMVSNSSVFVPQAKVLIPSPRSQPIILPALPSSEAGHDIVIHDSDLVKKYGKSYDELYTKLKIVWPSLKF